MGVVNPKKVKYLLGSFLSILVVVDELLEDSLLKMIFCSASELSRVGLVLIMSSSASFGLVLAVVDVGVGVLVVVSVILVNIREFSTILLSTMAGSAVFWPNKISILSYSICIRLGFKLRLAVTFLNRLW